MPRLRKNKIYLALLEVRKDLKQGKRKSLQTYLLIPLSSLFIAIGVIGMTAGIIRKNILVIAATYFYIAIAALLYKKAKGEKIF